MKCPSCNIELVKKKYEAAVEIDSCDSCGGMWLDYGELEKIQDIKVNDYKSELEKTPYLSGNAISLAKSKNKPHVNCPVCDRELERREYGYASQILIDSCVNGHGIWLDKDEINALEIFYERTREEVRQDDIKEMEEEKKKANDTFIASLYRLFK